MPVEYDMDRLQFEMWHQQKCRGTQKVNDFHHQPKIALILRSCTVFVFPTVVWKLGNLEHSSVMTKKNKRLDLYSIPKGAEIIMWLWKLQLKALVHIRARIGRFGFQWVSDVTTSKFQTVVLALKIKSREVKHRTAHLVVHFYCQISCFDVFSNTVAHIDQSKHKFMFLIFLTGKRIVFDTTTETTKPIRMGGGLVKSVFSRL